MVEVQPIVDCMVDGTWVSTAANVEALVVDEGAIV